jgi:signal transduction histidine kinase
VGLLNVAASAAGSVTLLERPISTLTLLRSVQVALRSRRRQYQVRDLVTQLANLNEMLEHRVRKRTAELSAANRKLENEISRRKGLEGQILEFTDREQQRLGQELHDGLCQHLTAVAFMTRGVALRLKNHRVIEVEDLEKIAALVNEAAVDARNMARGLHRLEVDSASLLPALRDLVSREIWRTPCRLQVKTEVNLHDDAVASHIYRLLREAMINAQKHARAKEIVVEIRQSNSETVFSVIDDGAGIPSGASKSDSLGFQIMDYRARTIGARLQVESRKKGGTCVACYLPQSK